MQFTRHEMYYKTKALLTSELRSRYDVTYLIFRFYEKECGINIPKEIYEKLLRCPSPETISRSRRKVLEDNPKLRIENKQGVLEPAKAEHEHELFP